MNHLPWAAFGVNLVLSAVVVAAYFAVIMAAAMRVRKHAIVDVFWGPGFALVAVISYLASAHSGGDAVRRATVLALTAIWGLRLAVHIGSAMPAVARTSGTPPSSVPGPAASPATSPAPSTGRRRPSCSWCHYRSNSAMLRVRPDRPGGRRASWSACGVRLRSRRRRPTCPLHPRSRQRRGGHGPGPVGVDAASEPLRRCLCLVSGCGCWPWATRWAC